MIFRFDDPLLVFAAASLSLPFKLIAANYERAHPGTTVRLNFSGSQTLSAQIKNGAPADVFASAAMSILVDSGAAPSSIRMFAQNRLILVVRPDSKTTSLADLSRAGRIVLADVKVPAGKYANEMLDRAATKFGASWRRAVMQRVVSRELDVKSVLRKVELGEADAGIVYASDVTPKVKAVTLPEAWNPTVDYAVGIVATKDRRRLAREFVKFLFAPESQAILVRSGFLSPLTPPASIIIDGRKVEVGFKRQESVSAKDHDGREARYTGALVATLTQKRTGKIEFVAADGYRQSFELADLINSRAIVTQASDGNLQLIVPGKSPDTWIKWIRRIDLK